MLCDNCHERDAVVNLTTIESNAVRQLHLCEQCAAERGVETSVATPKHPLGEFLQAVQQQSVAAIGCTASITKVLERFPDGRMNILVRGQRPFEISQLNDEKSYLRGRPQFLVDDPSEVPSPDLLERSMALHSRLKELARIETQAIQDTPLSTDTQLSYRLIAGVPAELAWQQSFLELRSERKRLALVVDYLEELIEQFESAPDKRRSPGPKIARLGSKSQDI